MKRAVALFLAWAFAFSTFAATLPATGPTLQTMAAAAHAGDTITLPAGPAGDGDIRNVAFAAPGVTITSADPKNPAVFRSMMVMSASGLNFDGVNINFTPDATTVDWSSFVQINSSHDIGWRHSIIHGGPAITGIPENATLDQQNADATGNVIGRPTGYAVNVVSSQHVALEFNDVSGSDRLVILNTVSDSLIGHNFLHDRRRTAIAGANLNRIIVNGNVVDGAVPWNWNNGAGVIGYADHADMMAFYSASGQAAANDNVAITNNIMAQRAGANILGMWAAGSAGSLFTNLTISGNLILAPNLQGIMLSDISGAAVSNNTLVQVPLPSMTAEQLVKQFPTVLLLAPDAGAVTTGITMTNNAVGVGISDRSGGTNTETGTTLTTPTKDSGVTEIRAWLPAHPDMVALAAPLLPASSPAAPPAVDPRDAQIADLTSKLGTANAQVATLNANLSAAAAAQTAAAAQVSSLTQQLSAAKAAQVASLAQVTTLQGQLAAAQGALAVSQKTVTSLTAQLAALQAKVTRAQADLK